MSYCECMSLSDGHSAIDLHGHGGRCCFGGYCPRSFLNITLWSECKPSFSQTSKRNDYVLLIAQFNINGNSQSSTKHQSRKYSSNEAFIFDLNYSYGNIFEFPDISFVWRLCTVFVSIINFFVLFIFLSHCRTHRLFFSFEGGGSDWQAKISPKRIMQIQILFSTLIYLMILTQTLSCPFPSYWIPWPHLELPMP